MKIYVASNWHSARRPAVIDELREAGHEVYDFSGPPSHSVQAGPLDAFESDMGALRWCEVCVLVMPCGSNAHLALGFVAAHHSKRTIILRDEESELELLYGMADSLCDSMPEVLSALARIDARKARVIADIQDLIDGRREQPITVDVGSCGAEALLRRREQDAEDIPARDLVGYEFYEKLTIGIHRPHLVKPVSADGEQPDPERPTPKGQIGQ